MSALPHDATGPLTGVRVVDFSKFVPGSYCTWMLADLGTDVVRIEHPREIAKQAEVFGWDRLSREELARLRAHAVFARNKRSLLIDPGAQAARPILIELIQRADVLVEDYRPGVLEAMGFGYEAMARVNPKLIYCSVTLCGQTGPYRDKPGHEPIALALSGALSQLGNRSDRPSLPGLPMVGLLSGSNAAIGILVALHARRFTNQGQRIDVAMSDSALALLGPLMSRHPDLATLPSIGHHQVDCGVWRTKDGRHLCTTDMEPRYWERFCRAVGRPDLVSVHRDATRRNDVIATIAAIIEQRPLAEWLQILDAAGTQFAAVQDLSDALLDPHAISRRMVHEVSIPGSDATARQIGSPIKLTGTPPLPPSAPGLPGSDSREILLELGLDPQAIDRLLRSGVVGVPADSDND